MEQISDNMDSKPENYLHTFEVGRSKTPYLLTHSSAMFSGLLHLAVIVCCGSSHYILLVSRSRRGEDSSEQMANVWYGQLADFPWLA